MKRWLFGLLLMLVASLEPLLMNAPSALASSSGLCGGPPNANCVTLVVNLSQTPTSNARVHVQRVNPISGDPDNSFDLSPTTAAQWGSYSSGGAVSNTFTTSTVCQNSSGNGALFNITASGSNIIGTATLNNVNLCYNANPKPDGSGVKTLSLPVSLTGGSNPNGGIQGKLTITTPGGQTVDCPSTATVDIKGPTNKTTPISSGGTFNTGLVLAPGTYTVTSVCQYQNNPYNFTYTNVVVAAGRITNVGTQNSTGVGTDPNAGAVDPNAGDPVDCDAGSGFTWIICGVIHFIVDTSDWMRENLIIPFLQEPPLDKNDAAVKPVYNLWSSFRNLASVFFILIFFLIVFGTAIGFDNYTIKKILPRLVAGAILVPFSWYICVIIIDIGNVLGQGIQVLMHSVIPEPQISFQTNLSKVFFGGAGAATIALGVGGAAAAITGISFGVLITFGLALLTMLLTLLARKVIILLLIILSPLALLAWILPNTERWYRRWWNLFIELVMMYPVVILIVEAGRLAASTIGALALGPSDIHLALITSHAWLAEGGRNAIVWFSGGYGAGGAVPTALAAGNEFSNHISKDTVPLIQLVILALTGAVLPVSYIMSHKGVKGVRNGAGKFSNWANRRYGKDSDFDKSRKAARRISNLNKAQQLEDRGGLLAGRRAALRRARAGHGYGFAGMGKGNILQQLDTKEAHAQAAATVGKYQAMRDKSQEAPKETIDERIAAERRSELNRKRDEQASRQGLLAGNVGATAADGRARYDAAFAAARRGEAAAIGTARGVRNNAAVTGETIGEIAGHAQLVAEDAEATRKGLQRGTLQGNLDLQNEALRQETVRLGRPLSVEEEADVRSRTNVNRQLNASSASEINATKSFTANAGTARGTVEGQRVAIENEISDAYASGRGYLTADEARLNLSTNATNIATREARSKVTDAASTERGILAGREAAVQNLIADAAKTGRVLTTEQAANLVARTSDSVKSQAAKDTYLHNAGETFGNAQGNQVNVQDEISRVQRTTGVTISEAQARQNLAAKAMAASNVTAAAKTTQAVGAEHGLVTGTEQAIANEQAAAGGGITATQARQNLLSNTANAAGRDAFNKTITTGSRERGIREGQAGAVQGVIDEYAKRGQTLTAAQAEDIILHDADTAATKGGQDEVLKGTGKDMGIARGEDAAVAKEMRKRGVSADTARQNLATRTLRKAAIDADTQVAEEYGKDEGAVAARDSAVRATRKAASKAAGAPVAATAAERELVGNVGTRTEAEAVKAASQNYGAANRITAAQADPATRVSAGDYRQAAEYATGKKVGSEIGDVRGTLKAADAEARLGQADAERQAIEQERQNVIAANIANAEAAKQAAGAGGLTADERKTIRDSTNLSAGQEAAVRGRVAGSFSAGQDAIARSAGAATKATSERLAETVGKEQAAVETARFQPISAADIAEQAQRQAEIDLARNVAATQGKLSAAQQAEEKIVSDAIAREVKRRADAGLPAMNGAETAALRNSTASVARRELATAAATTRRAETNLQTAADYGEDAGAATTVTAAVQKEIDEDLAAQRTAQATNPSLTVAPISRAEAEARIAQKAIAGGTKTGERKQATSYGNVAALNEAAENAPVDVADATRRIDVARKTQRDNLAKEEGTAQALSREADRDYKDTIELAESAAADRLFDTRVAEVAARPNADFNGLKISEVDLGEEGIRYLKDRFRQAQRAGDSTTMTAVLTRLRNSQGGIMGARDLRRGQKYVDVPDPSQPGGFDRQLVDENYTVLRSARSFTTPVTAADGTLYAAGDTVPAGTVVPETYKDSSGQDVIASAAIVDPATGMHGMGSNPTLVVAPQFKTVWDKGMKGAVGMDIVKPILPAANDISPDNFRNMSTHEANTYMDYYREQLEAATAIQKNPASTPAQIAEAKDRERKINDDVAQFNSSFQQAMATPTIAAGILPETAKAILHQAELHNPAIKPETAQAAARKAGTDAGVERQIPAASRRPVEDAVKRLTGGNNVGYIAEIVQRMRTDKAVADTVKQRIVDGSPITEADLGGPLTSPSSMSAPVQDYLLKQINPGKKDSLSSLDELADIQLKYDSDLDYRQLVDEAFRTGKVPPRPI